MRDKEFESLRLEKMAISMKTKFGIKWGKRRRKIGDDSIILVNCYFQYQDA